MTKNLLTLAICSALLSACGGSDNSGTTQPDTVISNSSTGNTSANSPADSDNAPQQTPGGENTSEEATQNTTPAPTPVASQDPSADQNTTTNISPADDSTDNADTTDNTDVSDSGTTDNSASDDGDASETQEPEILNPPSGLLNTAQPVFRWRAVANADAYKIVVKDADGNGYARSLDPVSASCQTGEGLCEATTDLAYYDNDLDWHVESTIDGAPGPNSETFSITTPVSEDLMPIKSNVSDCEAWASIAYGKYVVLNNSWNSRAMNRQDWSQLINVTENANGSITPAWSYDWLGQFDGGEIDVKAYPEVLYGPKLGTHVSGTREETGLPAKVTVLPEFVVTYDYSETGNAERNVAIESFFHDSDDIRGPCHDETEGGDNRVYEMMIWVNNPTIRTPGKLALTGVMVDNQLWNVYIKPDSNKHYIAFTAQNPTTRGTLNYKRFVEWTSNWTTENAESLEIDALNPEFYMGAIEIGTEMWWGDGTFTLNEFNVTF